MTSQLRTVQCFLLAVATCPPGLAQSPQAKSEYRRRVDAVRHTPGFVALWDFVKREESGNFAAHQARGDTSDLHLDAVNYVREWWQEGRPATYADFPLLGRGPFGQAIQLRAETAGDFRPLLLVPRSRLRDSRLDVKGPGGSVSMVVWMLYQSGNHAIAGIWHEGTDLPSAGVAAKRVESGQRQYALFAGLAANRGAVAAHVSENGASSFSDKYARNLAVTPERIPDDGWSVAGFTFDDARHTVTAYLNGKASELWIDHPERHPFFQWPAKGWRQAQRRDPEFPHDQLYQPPEDKVLAREVLEERGDERVELHHFAFTRVRVSLRRGRDGAFSQVVNRELVALKVNPYWFGHHLWTPAPDTGGPFTIGRVIHMGRSGDGFVGHIGGVAVFSRPLSPQQMQRLAAIGRRRTGGRLVPDLLRGQDLAQYPAR